MQGVSRYFILTLALFAFTAKSAEPEPTPNTASTKKIACRWNECLWQPYPWDLSVAEKKGLSGPCLERARTLAELDLMRFTAPMADSRDWTVAQPGPLIDEVLRIRDLNACPAAPIGLERVFTWDSVIQSACPLAKAALGEKAAALAKGVTPPAENPAVGKCLTAVLIYRASAAALLHGEASVDSFQETATPVHLFYAELYEETPRLEKLASLLERFLTILPGDSVSLARLAEIYFAAWATKPSPAMKTNLERTVSRLELYTQKTEDLYRLEFMRAIAGPTPLAMRRWGLKLAETGVPNSASPYFLAWSAFLDGNSKQAQHFLRLAVKPQGGDWGLEAHVGLKRLLARKREISSRPIFLNPSVAMGLSFSVYAESPTRVEAGTISLYASDARRPGELEEVKEALAELRDRGPVRTDLEDYLYASAIIAIDAGQFALAKTSLLELSQLNPENPSIGNLTKAMELKEKLRINPKDAESALLLGQVWFQEKQYAAAANQMRKLLARHPGNERAQLNLEVFQQMEQKK